MAEKNEVARLSAEVERLQSAEAELNNGLELDELVEAARRENPDQFIYHPNERHYENRPSDVRLAGENKIKEIAKKLELRRDEIRTELEQVVVALGRASQREAVRKAEEARIAKNVRDFGDIRPESVERFNKLADEDKGKLLRLFGPTFIQTLREKSESGYSWAQFDRLKNLQLDDIDTEGGPSKASDKPTIKVLKDEKGNLILTAAQKRELGLREDQEYRLLADCHFREDD